MTLEKGHRLDFEADLIGSDGEDIHVPLWANDPSIENKIWVNMLLSRSYRAGSCGGARIAD